MMLDLSAEGLLRLAQRQTGLSDFGDPDVFVALNMLTGSLEAETDFTEDGRAAVHTRLLRLLVNRLRFERDRRRHPAIGAQSLLPPVVISSLPRCGSTKLHRLLAETGDFQALLFWQIYNAAPFPDAVPGEPDPRIADATFYVDWRNGKSPQARAGHAVEVMEPEEETYLIEQTFTSMAPAAHYEVPAYLRWLRGQDRAPIYAYLREQLRYLQWQHHGVAPRPFLLKAPANIGYEREMLAALPGARFIMLHRDPVEAVTSLATMVREMRRMHCVELPPYEQVLDWVLTDFGAGLDRQMAWRAANPDAPIFDVAYRDVCNNDMETVRAVYRYLDMALTDEKVDRMRRWLSENVQHRYGRLAYSADSDDPLVARIRARFEDYSARFGSYF